MTRLRMTIEKRLVALKTCKLCQERGKTWHGDNPNCAFPDGTFVERNWNCATANAVRELCDTETIHSQWVDDQNYAVIPLQEWVYEGWDDEWHGDCLWVSWYKRRGRTDSMILLPDCSFPTEEFVVHIVEAYRRQGWLD